MTFVPFAMERWQSTWEHHVAVNLSESGVEPLTVRGLLELAGRPVEELESVALEYVQSNGARPLRAEIADLYPDATPERVLVTTGSAEANLLATWELAGDGGEIVFMEPNYFQVHGLARDLDVPVKEWWLDREGWRPRLDELEDLVDERTRMIVVTSPNNPTGARFDDDFRRRVVAIADRVGAWVLADEVYRGAERDGVTAGTFQGLGERVIVTGGLSKAYGLPGLRLGWAVAPEEMTGRLWARKDYTTISVGALSQYLATLALQPDNRERLLERSRSILRRNWKVLEAWLQEREEIFRWTPPEAGAIAMVDYDLPLGSGELVERVRRQEDCLLVPGDHFRLGKSLRLGFGLREELLVDGLARFGRVIDGLSSGA